MKQGARRFVARLGLVLCLAPLGLQAAPGYQLKLADKSPLVLRVLDIADPSEPLPLKEPALYLGASLVWQPLSKTVELELGTGKATLMLNEPWVYLDQRRLSLPQALRWKDGRLVLDRASLELVLKSIAPNAPALESVTAEALAQLAPPRATPAAEPTVVPTDEPQLVTHTEPAASIGQARPLKLIVIDAGHGGYDPGAHGPNGLEEKATCLDIALRLNKLIHASLPGVKVILTRSTDNFVTLRNRTKIANEADADLFISIHNNASPNSKGRGSQVFFYDSRSSDRAAEDLAKRENEDANYLEILMMDLAKSLVRDQSIQVALDVAKELGSDIGIQNRKLSYAPFYVLARTKMPAILVEVAFITNPREEALLRSSAFREQVAEGVFRGVKKYGQETSKR